MIPKPLLRTFTKATLACALTALVAAVLALRVIYAFVGPPLLDGVDEPAGIGEAIAGTLFLLPFGILFGSCSPCHRLWCLGWGWSG